LSAFARKSKMLLIFLCLFDKEQWIIRESRRWNQSPSSVPAQNCCRCTQTTNLCRRRCRRPATALTTSPRSAVRHLRRYMSARRRRAMRTHSFQSLRQMLSPANRKKTSGNHVTVTSSPTSTWRSTTSNGEHNLTQVWLILAEWPDTLLRRLQCQWVLCVFQFYVIIRPTNILQTEQLKVANDDRCGLTVRSVEFQQLICLTTMLTDLHSASTVDDILHSVPVNRSSRHNVAFSAGYGAVADELAFIIHSFIDTEPYTAASIQDWS